MELTIALAISILGCVISVCSFVLSRKDKAVKDTKEESGNQKLIDYRLTQLEKKVDQVLDKLDRYDDEITNKVEKAIEEHIKLYHSKEN